MNERIKRDIEHLIERGILEHQTLGDAFYEVCKRQGERIAVVDDIQSLSFAQLWRECNRIAALFHEEGLRKGDNVLLQIPNSVEYVKVLFGLFLLGARPVLMLPDHSDVELVAVGELVRPKAIITVEEELGIRYGERAKRVAEKVSGIEKIFLDRDAEYAVSINRPCRRIMLPFDAHQPKPYDIALFLLSGGTTGTPKVIPRIHAAYLLNAKLSSKRCEVTEKSVYLAALSTSHDYPLSCPGLIGTLLAGGKCVLSKTASPEEGMEWIRREDVTFTQLVPVVAAAWVDAMQGEDQKEIPKLRHMEIGAAKLEWDLAVKLQEMFQCKVIQGYGLGEGITCFTKMDDPDEVAFQTQGTPVSSEDQIRIVDENGKEVARGEAGEVWEKGPYTFYGYYRAPERNRNLFSEDGFLKTGDKGMITTEGNLVILGRVREQINRAGENVIPEEIESFIRRWKYCKEVAVIGVDDAELGEAICAVIVKEEKEGNLEDLRAFLSTLKIARYKYPDRLVYMEKLPYVNVGKVDKKELKKMIVGEKKQ